MLDSVYMYDLNAIVINSLNTTMYYYLPCLFNYANHLMFW